MEQRQFIYNREDSKRTLRDKKIGVVPYALAKSITKRRPAKDIIECRVNACIEFAANPSKFPSINSFVLFKKSRLNVTEWRPSNAQMSRDMVSLFGTNWAHKRGGGGLGLGGGVARKKIPVVYLSPIIHIFCWFRTINQTLCQPKWSIESLISWTSSKRNSAAALLFQFSFNQLLLMKWYLNYHHITRLSIWITEVTVLLSTLFFDS